jgi:hypothetical protein
MGANLQGEEQPPSEIELNKTYSFSGLPLNSPRVFPRVKSERSASNEVDVSLIAQASELLSKRLCGIQVIADDLVSGSSSFCKMWLERIWAAFNENNLEAIEKSLRELGNRCEQAIVECGAEMDDYLLLQDTTAVSYGHDGIMYLETKLNLLATIGNALEAALGCIESNRIL